MGGTLAVREFKSAAEMRAHYAELQRRCFSGVSAQPAKATVSSGAPAEADLAAQELVAPGPKRSVLAEEWDEFFERTRDRFGRLSKQPSKQQRDGVATITGQEAMRIAAEVSGVGREHICGERRTVIVVKARQIAFWLLVRHAGKSLSEAGRIVGNRDHTCALLAVRKVDAMLSDRGIAFDGCPDTIARTLWAAAWPQKSTRSGTV